MVPTNKIFDALEIERIELGQQDRRCCCPGRKLTNRPGDASECRRCDAGRPRCQDLRAWKQRDAVELGQLEERERPLGRPSASVVIA